MPAVDYTSRIPDEIESPARRCWVLVPNDAADQPILCKALRAPSDGFIRLQAVDADDPVRHPVFAGEVVPVRCVRVFVTGTTVTGDIVGYA